jgi:hypothetical protein
MKAAALWRDAGRGARCSFVLRKSTKKTSAPLRAFGAPAAVTSNIQSFFCFFFVHKKEDSFFILIQSGGEE